jgi:hypothetical protein
MSGGLTLLPGTPLWRRTQLKAQRQEYPYIHDTTCPCALNKHHVMKAYWGSGGIDPHINLGTRCGQLHAPAALPQGKGPWYPLDRRLGGPQNRSRRSGEEKNSQPLPGLEPPIIQFVAQR